MKSHIIERIMSSITLRTKLQVSNQMAFMSLITDIGYRKGMWTEEENELILRLINLSNKHTESIIEEIEDHLKIKIQ